MAKRIVTLNESELKTLIKEAILELAPTGLSELAPQSDNTDDDEYDPFSKYGIGDINDVTGGGEYHGEMDQDEFNEPDPDDVEAQMDADVNTADDRDVNPDDIEPETGNGQFVPDEPEEGPITPLSQPNNEPEEQHQEGDVIYYENTPIEFKNGQYHMTIEDGFDMGDAKCPKITVVGSSLKAVKSEYDHLWDNFYYKDHADYVKQMQEQGLAEYDFSTVGAMDPSQINLEELPVIINLDK